MPKLGRVFRVLLTVAAMLMLAVTLRAAAWQLPVHLAGTATPTPLPTAPPPTPEPEPTYVPPTPTRLANATVGAPTATPVLVEPLSRELLRNITYPVGWATNGVARLSDGTYREASMGATLRVYLEALDEFGDLNGDGVDDAAVILVTRPDAEQVFCYLFAVLNDHGRPVATGGALLGERVLVRALRIEEGRIVVEMDTYGPNAQECCPDQTSRCEYQVADEELCLMAGSDLPLPRTQLPSKTLPQRVTFPQGVRTARLTGRVPATADRRFLLHLTAGQAVTLTATVPEGKAHLSCLGVEDGAVLLSIRDGKSYWSGRARSTQDYLITLVATHGGNQRYALDVLLSSPAVSAPPDAPVDPLDATPQTNERVIYLTFDDGPSKEWTPRVAELLARYDARATFFEVGQLAAKNAKLVQELVRAGHAVGNHTYDHRTTANSTCDEFVAQVRQAGKVFESVLGADVPCVRPPYGALGAYTRAYATELGYRVVMWSIDSGDWRRPGANAIAAHVLERAAPGAVVLFHDGPGDRAQTLKALEIILESLSSQGYWFEPICP